MKSTALSRLGMLSCLTSRDEETKLFLSHCLNFDLIEWGKTPDESWENLKSSVKQFVEYCYTNYQEGLSVSAGRDEWEEFAEMLKNSDGPGRVDTIEIELKPPLPEYQYPIWMQEIIGHGSPRSHVQ